MSTNSKDSEAEQLKSAGIIVDNSLSIEEVKIEVAKKGYDETELQAGKTKIIFAQQALSDQAKKAGIAKDATRDEANAKSAAHSAYQDLAQIIRNKYSANSPELTKLGLVSSEPKTTADSIKAGYTLFDNAASDTEIAAYILKKGYTPEFIKSERDKFSAYEIANAAQVKAIGLAGDATKVKVDAFKDMNEWISEYKTTAKVALRKKPALLEQLGIKIKKRGTSQKKRKSTAAANTPAK